MLNLALCIACYISFESIFCADFKNVKCYWNLLNLSIFIAIYDSSGQNDNFRQKHKIWSCDAVFHSKSSAYDDAIGFVHKFHSWRHLGINIENFQNFTNDVIMTGSDQTPRIHYLVVWAKNKIVMVSLTPKMGFA